MFSMKWMHVLLRFRVFFLFYVNLLILLREKRSTYNHGKRTDLLHMIAVTFPSYKNDSVSLYLPRCHSTILKNGFLFPMGEH